MEIEKRKKKCFNTNEFSSSARKHKKKNTETHGKTYKHVALENHSHW